MCELAGNPFVTFAALIAFCVAASAAVNRMAGWDGAKALLVSWGIPVVVVLLGCQFQCGVLAEATLVGCIPTAVGVALSANGVFSWDVTKTILGKLTFLRQPAVVRANT